MDQFNFSNINNNPTIDIGIKLGTELGSKYIASSNEWFSLNFLKPYFSINNKYVIRKIKQVILPFLYREPELTDEEDFEDNYFQIAKSKIEYPDMYLPLVSFMSYVLLISFNFAMSEGEAFDPEYLWSKCSKNFTIVIAHMLLLKGFLYVFCNINFSALDLICYVSYKFIYTFIFSIIWILTKSATIYYFFFILFSLVSMFFMVCFLNLETSNKI